PPLISSTTWARCWAEPCSMSSCGGQAVDIRHWTLGWAMTAGASAMTAAATAAAPPAFARNLRRSSITPSPPWLGGDSASGRAFVSRTSVCPTNDGRRAERLAPAGHGERVAGDVARLVGGEEEHGVGDLEGLAEAAQRGHVIGAVLHRLVQPSQPGPEPLGVDRARRHRVHVDAMLGQLEGDVPHEAVHARLGGGVRGAALVVGGPRRALPGARGHA